MTTTSENPKPKALVTNYLDAEEELKPSPEVVIEKVTKGKKTEYQAKLIQSGNVFSGYSIEDVMRKGYASTAKYWEYYKSMGVLRKCINMVGNFTTRAGFETTIRCLDENDDPERPEYIKVKKIIDDLNRKVNLDNILRITQIKRLIHGNAGWEIVPDRSTNSILRIDPLHSSYIQPIVKKNVFTGINYAFSSTGVIPKEKLLYFTYDVLENNASSLVGISSIRSIERNIKIKKNLERDLLYASRSLWAPIVIYSADTRGLTASEEDALFTTLQTDLRPGAIVITNRAVESDVTQYSPDLNNLIRAIDKQDEEIIGNYGIPKALLSREKTMARATLEFSLRAFYESSIAGEQAYLKRELERQWYDPIVESLGYNDRIRISHEWRPILSPAADLMTALVRAVEAGVIDGEKFYRELGWQLDKVPEKVEEPKEDNGNDKPKEEDKKDE